MVSDQISEEIQERFILKKVIRFGLILLGVLSLLFICLLLIIKLLFPAQELKRLAENKLEEILNKKVRIEMIQFNPLSGIELANLIVGDEELQFLSVKKVSLQYDFKQLFRRKLVINRISINKPVINLKHIQNQWNIPLLKPGVQLKDETKTDIDRKPEIPILPFDIDIKAFNIKDLSLALNYDNNIAAEVSGINFFLTGSLSSTSYNVNVKIFSSPGSAFSYQQASPEKIRFDAAINNRLDISFQKLNAIPVKGELKFNNLSVSYPNHIALNQLSIDLNLLLNMAEGKIQLNRINIASNDFFNLILSGEIHRVLEQLKFNLILKDSFINLKKTNQYISALIPDSNIEGHLGITQMSLVGSLQNENKVDADVQGLFFFDNIGIAYSKPNFSLKNASGTIKLNKLDLKGNFPDKLDAEVKLHFDTFISKTISLAGLQKNIHIFSSEKTPGEQIVNFDIKSDEVTLNIKNQPPITFPFKLEGSLVSNLANLDLKSSHIEWNLPGIAAGKITASYLTSDHNRFLINNIINLDIEKIWEYVPGAYLQRIDELKLSGKLSSKINLAGQLNRQYLPENIEFKVSNNLKNIYARNKSLQIVLTGLNVKSSAKGKYYGKKGIELRAFAVEGNFTNVKFTDQINIGKSKYSFAAKDMGPFNFKNISKINIDGKSKSEPAGSISYQANLHQIMNPVFNVIALKDKFLKKMRLSCDISTENIQVANKMFSDKVKFTFTVVSPPEHINKPEIHIDLTTEGLRIHDTNRINLKNNISAHLILLLDAQNKSITIKNADIGGLPLFSISLHQGMINSENKFKLQDLNILLNMKGFWQNIPRSYHKIFPLQNLSGAMRFSTNAEGVIPSKINISEFDLPFKFSSNLKIDNMTLELKQHNLKIKNLNSKTNINNLDSTLININGTTSVGSVIEDFQSILPKLSDIYFQYDYSLNDLNTLNINNSTLKINNGIISQSLQGVIKGFNSMLTQNVPFSALEILKRVNLKLNSELSINRGKKFFLRSSTKFTGGLSTNVIIRLIPGEKLSLDGNIEFKNFTFKKDDFLINNITGNIPIKKSYLFINKKTNLPVKHSNKFISQSGLFSDLRSYSKHKDLISIGSVKAGKRSIKHILLDLYLNKNRFAVEQFSFKLEGGTVLGNVYFLPGDTVHKLFLKTNFASIDLKKILKIKSGDKEEIDSKINGNAELIISVSPETKTTGFKLDQIETNLNITRIGDNALDQLLIFFDPGESNPSIANLKAKLRLAKPVQINIKLKNKRLSMFVRLKTHLTESGFLDIQALNRIPVQRLKQFSLIEENLKEISRFLKIIKIWTSNYIKLNKDWFVLR